MGFGIVSSLATRTQTNDNIITFFDLLINKEKLAKDINKRNLGTTFLTIIAQSVFIITLTKWEVGI